MKIKSAERVRTRQFQLFSVAAVTLVSMNLLTLPIPAEAQKAAPAKAAKAGEISWGTDLKAGIEEARSKKKYLFVDMYTDWCGWCKRLDRTTFVDPQMMSYLNNKYVCLKINAENPNGGREAAEKYRVSGFPCALVFDPSGKLIGKVSGYYKPDEYQVALERLIKKPPADPLAE